MCGASHRPQPIQILTAKNVFWHCQVSWGGARWGRAILNMSHDPKVEKCSLTGTDMSRIKWNPSLYKECCDMGVWERGFIKGQSFQKILTKQDMARWSIYKCGSVHLHLWVYAGLTAFIKCLGNWEGPHKWQNHLQFIFHELFPFLSNASVLA